MDTSSNRIQRRPEWIRVKIRETPEFKSLKRLTRGLKLSTVCEEARCPNIYECWHNRTATFMLFGDICTRNCRFCSVGSGKPTSLDPDEPANVAEAVKTLQLDHVVITSVTRDDLEDGGAAHFAETITQVRAIRPTTRVEVLIPDFGGSEAALATLMAVRPDILGHNIETVPRLYRTARAGASYERSLELLARAGRYRSETFRVLTKSGVMCGLGESNEELAMVMDDLRAQGVDILTLGQYLQPTRAHLPVARFYAPEEFEHLKALGEEKGFRHVEAGPLVRSSYHALEQASGLEI